MKILVVQLGKIGDLVCTTPLLRTLADNLREGVDLLAGNFAADLLAGNTAVGQIFTRDVDPRVIAEGRYTHALILMPNVEIWQKLKIAGIDQRWGTVHPRMRLAEKLQSFFYLTRKFPYRYGTSIPDHYLNMAKELGIKNIINTREVHFRDPDRNAAEEFYRQAGITGKQVVGISVTGGKDYKEWGAENYVKLVNELNNKGFVVIGVGTKEEAAKLAAIKSQIQKPEGLLNTAGQFSLSSLAAIISKMFCFIAADTGPLYIADALGVPVIDLMGPCSSGGQKPLSPRAQIIGECFNPQHPKCYMMYSPSALRAEYLRCMQEIKFEEVWNAFEHVYRS